MSTKLLRVKQAAHAFRVRELTDEERRALFYREQAAEHRKAQKAAEHRKAQKAALQPQKPEPAKRKRRHMHLRGHSRSFGGLNFSRASRIPR